MKTQHLPHALFLLLIALIYIPGLAQLPPNIQIIPEDANGFQEITLRFFPENACVPPDHQGLAGLDSIAMHSSCYLVDEDPWSWGHIIRYYDLGFNGQASHLYRDSDTSYAITFVPADFYGTLDTPIAGISAVFNDGFNWARQGKDNGPEGCQNFLIPLHTEKASVTFSVNMTHQIFLGRFDPQFDFLDVAGNFNDWGNPGATMTDIADGVIDSIYSVTVENLDVGRLIEFKFRIDKDWGKAEILGFQGNRTFRVVPGNSFLSYWYDDALPIMKTVNLNINMNYLLEKGEFDPAQDSVDVAGTFNDWGFGNKELWLTDTDGDAIYSIVIDSLYVGQWIEYKFRLNGNWDSSEFPNGGPNRVYTVVEDTNIVYQWYNDENPSILPGLFFSDYIDGTGDNNALVITNKTETGIDLSEYGIMVATNGSDWSAPVNLSGILPSNDVFLIVHPGFDLSELESPGDVDMSSSAICSFNGNDAIALVKIYALGTRFRIVDIIGEAFVNPGAGWSVAGIPDATAGKRLSRKVAVFHGQPEWNLSAGFNTYDSEWNVLPALVPEKLGTFKSLLLPGNLWKIQYSEQDVRFRSIDFRQDGFGIAVGRDGIAYKSDNNGQNWTQFDLGGPNDLWDIQFTPDNHAWIAGSGGELLHSRDGLSWENKGIEGDITNISSVCFLDSLTGFAAGDFMILRTLDGGDNWEWLHTDFMDIFLKIFFIDDKVGWLVGWNVILNTTDGGDSWNHVPFEPETQFRSVFFTDRMNGWLVGLNDVVFRTTDGGQSWYRQKVSTNGGWIRDVYFVSEKIGWLTGGDGEIFMTLDGGANWIQQYSGTDERLFDISFVSRNKGWIVGGNGIILSTLDGWTKQNTMEGNNYNSMFFTDKQTGWAVGDQGTIVYTNDAGIKWDTLAKIHHAPMEPHFDIFFSDQKNGWIATSGGFIYKTEDGGTNWNGVHTGNPEWYQSVFFIDSEKGWATAGNGVIARTDDGGDTWNYITHGPGRLWTDVFFINESTGWVVGQDGDVIKSTNGGLNWTIQETPAGTGFLTAVHFMDSNTGIAVGDQGTIIRTTDGGTTWTRIESNTGKHLEGLFFIDNLVGWITGQSGTIMHTRDGGETWFILPKATDFFLHDVFFVDQENGWAVGDNGTILKTSSAGCEDPFVDLPWRTRICEGQEVLINAGEAAEYEWSTGADSPSIYAGVAGYYKVMVRNACKQEAKDSVYIDVKELPQFQMRTDRVPVLCKGESVNIEIEVENSITGLNYDYFWNSISNDTFAITVDTSGYFAVDVVDGYGCSRKDSLEVIVQYPWDEKIALVTYDIEEQKNLVVWKKTSDRGTYYYNIYKVQASQNVLLGSSFYDQITAFVDATSNPRQQSDRYVITTVDTCFNESFYSSSHKTMHLTSNEGTDGEVNLIWEHYEGIPINWYYIFRATDSTKMVLYDSVNYDPGKTQYTDENVPDYKVYYQIGVKLSQPVVLDDGKKAGSGPWVHSLSNLEDNKLKTSASQGTGFGKMNIYPNPTTGIITLEIPGEITKSWVLSVYNSYGKLLLLDKIPSNKTDLNLDISSMPKGLYLVMLENGNHKFIQQLVLE